MHVGRALQTVESPDTRPGRDGWIRSVCAKCGQLIGYRPSFEFKRSSRRREDALDIASMGEAYDYE